MTTLSRNNANDNPLKARAREFLCLVSNGKFGDIDGNYRMLELLAEGHGARRYSSEIVGLSAIDGVESDMVKFNNFVRTNTDPKIVPIAGDIKKQIVKACSDGIKYDIINLDFCQFYYPFPYIGKTVSGSDNIRHLLNNTCFKVGSLIFVTFMARGFQVEISKYNKAIMTDPSTICDNIIEIAAERGISISLVDEGTISNGGIFVYKPGPRGWNEMMHAGFIVEEM